MSIFFYIRGLPNSPFIASFQAIRMIFIYIFYSNSGHSVCLSSSGPRFIMLNDDFFSYSGSWIVFLSWVKPWKLFLFAERSPRVQHTNKFPEGTVPFEISLTGVASNFLVLRYFLLIISFLKNVKVCTLVTHSARACPSFHSILGLAVFLFPLG